MIDTLNRLMKHKSDVQDKLKSLKKEKYLNEISALTDRPTISPNSKRLCSYSISPIYIRTDLEIKAKEQRLAQLRQKKNQQDEETFTKNCTFAPNHIGKSRRAHEDLVNSCLKWQDRHNQQRRICEEENIRKQISQLQGKPNISENSRKIAEKVRKTQRSQTPVLERLTRQEPSCVKWTPKKSEIRSNISENSKKLISKSKLKTYSTQPPISEEKLSESVLEFHSVSDFNKTFKINSSRKLSNISDVNFVEFYKILDLLKPLGSNKLG